MEGTFANHQKIIIFVSMKQFPVVISILLALASCSPDKEAMRERLAYVSQCNRADTLFNEAWLPTVDSLVSYFDRHGNANERMKAHYLQGRIYHDMGDAPQALACYRDAANAADTTDQYCDLKTLSRIYGQMALLFHRQRTPTLEIQYARLAERVAYRAEDTLSAIVFSCGVAGAYDMLNMEDSVLSINETAARLFRLHGREDLAASSLAMNIWIHVKRHDASHAKAIMDDYEGKSGFFDKEGNIAAGKEIYYSVKGQYYQITGKLDFAGFYYRKLLGYGITNPDYKESAYHGLMDVYHQLGKEDSITKYASLYADATDSTIVRHSSEELVRMQSLYNYNEKQKLADQKALEAERYKNTIFVVIGISVIVITTLLRWWEIRRRKALVELGETNARYANAISQYNQLREDLEASIKDYSKYRMSKEQELEKLKTILSTFQDDETMPEHWDLESAILGSPIVARFHQLAVKLVIPSEKEWEDLYCLLHERIPSFYNYINENRFSLTDYERKASMLIRLRFIPSELAVLLDLSKQRVSNIRRDINRKLFRTNGTKMLDVHIRRL